MPVPDGQRGIASQVGGHLILDHVGGRPGGGAAHVPCERLDGRAVAWHTGGTNRRRVAHVLRPHNRTRVKELRPAPRHPRWVALLEASPGAVEVSGRGGEGRRHGGVVGGPPEAGGSAGVLGVAFHSLGGRPHHPSVVGARDFGVDEGRVFGAEGGRCGDAGGTSLEVRACVRDDSKLVDQIKE